MAPCSGVAGSLGEEGGEGKAGEDGSVGEIGEGRVKRTGSFAVAFEPVERARLRLSGSAGDMGGDAGVVGARVRGVLLIDTEGVVGVEAGGGGGDCTRGGGGGEIARVGGGGGDTARAAMSGRETGSSGRRFSAASNRFNFARCPALNSKDSTARSVAANSAKLVIP